MIEWGEIYCIGIEAVDNQHKLFFDIVERAQAMISQANEDKVRQIYSLIKELQQYACSHFEYEEQIMQEIQYPDIVDHALEHSIFKAQITGIDKTIVEKDTEKYLLRMLDFIVEWVILHIGSEDIKFSKYYLENKNRVQ